MTVFMVAQAPGDRYPRPMREVGLGVVAALLLVVIGTHVVGGPIPLLWAHALAHECDGDTESRRCVESVPASVAEVRGDDVTLSAPARGVLHARFPDATPAEGDAVSVSVLDKQVLDVTGADGTTVDAEPEVRTALIRFALVSFGSILLVAAVGLWRRGGWWVWPMAGSVAAGTVLGLGAGSVAGHDLAMPVLFGVTALVSLTSAHVWMVHVQPRLLTD
jgi:hypothetical protein